MENGDNKQPKSSNSKENGLTPYQQLLQSVIEKNQRTEVVINEVEVFLKAYNERSIVITPEARTFVVTFKENKKGFLGREKIVVTKNNYCDAIGGAITAYQVSKELNYRLKWDNAYELLDLIQRGKVYGVIKDKEKQERDYQAEIDQLKQRLDSLQKLNDKLVIENKRLHNLIPEKKTSGEWEAGDVSK